MPKFRGIILNSVTGMTIFFLSLFSPFNIFSNWSYSNFTSLKSKLFYLVLVTLHLTPCSQEDSKFFWSFMIKPLSVFISCCIFYSTIVPFT